MRALILAVGFTLLAAEGAAQTHPDHGSAAIAATSAEARAADIAVFREQFLASDRSYSPDARTEAVRRLARLDAERATISQAYLELELARIVALADNGHTASFPGPRSRRYNRVALRFAPFGEDFYVLRARDELAQALGARLVAIDGVPIATLRDAARSLSGGVPQWRDRNAGYLFESPEQMHALGLIQRNNGARYRLATADGAMLELDIVADPADPNRVRANADRWMYPELDAAESGWRTLASAEQAPWALRDPGDPFRWRAAPDLDGLVIELRQNNDAEDQTIAAFMAEARAAIASNRPRNLVLDMRMNGGGDLNTTRDFMEALPRLVSGRIFVLTSPWTFSAAISSVGYLAQAAPERVTIIGEAVGDRLNFFSEGEVVTLPNAGAALLNATERHDYATGCRGFPDCHGPVRRHPIAVSTLAPDIAAPWTIEAYRAGRDPGMEAVAAALH